MPQVKRSRRQPNLKGEATVMIEWSWRVERRRSIEVGSFSSERRMDSGIGRLAGPRIDGIEVAGRLPEIVIRLGDGRWVHSFMTDEGQPAWALFLPDGTWVTVERGHLVHDAQNQRNGRRHSRQPKKDLQLTAANDRGGS